jgi:hypothetical protein
MVLILLLLLTNFKLNTKVMMMVLLVKNPLLKYGLIIQKVLIRLFTLVVGAQPLIKVVLMFVLLMQFGLKLKVCVNQQVFLLLPLQKEEMF